MLPLLLATRNSHKTAEFAEILGGSFVISDLHSLTESSSQIEETGATFQENAILKAVAASQFTNLLVVADDSGLEVEALGGAPGVRSARYAGENPTDQDNVAKLLTAMRALELPSKRNARFRCALALTRTGELLRTFEGEVRGTIATEVRGDAGFGYDPIFIPDEYEYTFAQLGTDIKNALSHRARAIAELRSYLERSADG